MVQYLHYRHGAYQPEYWPDSWRFAGATTAGWTEIGLTLNIVNCNRTQILRVGAGQAFSTIQAAVDAAAAGDIILVGSANYNENVIMYKPVRLQGFGTGSTFINGNPTPLDRLQTWHNRMNALNGANFVAYLLKNPFQENDAPTILVAGEIEFPNGNVKTLSRVLSSLIRETPSPPPMARPRWTVLPWLGRKPAADFCRGRNPVI